MYFRSDELVITSTKSVESVKGKVSKTVSEVPIKSKNFLIQLRFQQLL
jgi:hypothetical protein